MEIESKINNPKGANRRLTDYKLDVRILIHESFLGELILNNNSFYCKLDIKYFIGIRIYHLLDIDRFISSLSTLQEFLFRILHSQSGTYDYKLNPGIYSWKLSSISSLVSS